MNYYSIFSMGFIPAKQPTGTFEAKAGKSRVRQCSHNRIGGPLLVSSNNAFHEKIRLMQCPRFTIIIRRMNSNLVSMTLPAQSTIGF